MGMVGHFGPSLPERFAPYLFRGNMDGIMSTGASTVDVTTNTAGVSGTTNKGIAAYRRLSDRTKIKGLILGQAARLAGASANIDFNMGIWTATVDGSNNWSPNALVAGLEGTVALPIIAAANETNISLAFASSVVLPPDDYFIAGCYRYTGTVSAGSLKTVTFCRGLPMGTGAPGESRYDLHSTTNVTYTTGTIAALFSGLSWVAVASGSFANINWGLWCEQ